MAVKIGIIGAGHIGGTLTRKLTALGHDVRVANSRSPETLKDLALETGATGKDLVLRLVDDLGFDPVDAGGLEESWRQQPGTPVYGKDYDSAGVKAALARATPQRPAEFRPCPSVTSAILTQQVA